MEKPLTIVQMAEELNVSSYTVRRLAKAGTIPSFRVGSLWRFDRQAVISQLNAPVVADPWARKTTRRRAA